MFVAGCCCFAFLWEWETSKTVHHRGPLGYRADCFVLPSATLWTLWLSRCRVASRKSLLRCSPVPYNLKIVLKYSIVVPLHNEQENVTDLYARLKSVMEASGETFEMVLVDDGSIDGTFPLLREIAAVDSRVTVVKLRRNFGQTAGLAAGFDHARGGYLIAMDGDLP